jgi:predicted CoA-substrate-specific enzyme activase
MLSAGIDIGSSTTKTVILDGNSKVVAHSILPTGTNSKKAAEISLEKAISSIGLQISAIGCTVSTGIGRGISQFGHYKITEITCHGRGVNFLFPDTRTVIDIGGHDSKVIKINGSGKVLNFVMNDSCAAGSGRFLEVMARALEVDLSEMGELSLSSENAAPIDNTCIVFAETEVISLIANGYDKLDIIAGLHWSIAKRVIMLIRRLGIEETIAMTGGVAKNIGIVKAIENMLGSVLFIPEEPQITGALGAALIANERYNNM